MARLATAAPRRFDTGATRQKGEISGDAELLRQFLDSTEATAESAFVALVDRHGPIVYRVCLDVLGSSHEAEDASQAVFLVLARKARSIRRPDSLGPWLHGVSLRVAKHARKAAARRRVAERHKAQLIERKTAELEPQSMIDYTELHEEIARLPEKYRRPIILCYMEGHTQERAARVLSWPLGTVQTRLHRGRELLRKRLTRSRAGIFAVMTSSELATLLIVRPKPLERDWTEATARAAVRFAAGRGTSGIVPHTVAGLAQNVLATMFLRSFKVVSPVLIALCAGAAGLYWDVSRADETREGRVPRLPIGSALATTNEPAGSQPKIRIVANVNGEKAEQQAANASERVQDRRTIQSAPRDDFALVTPPNGSSTGASPGGVGGSSARTLEVGRDLFQKVWRQTKGRDGEQGDGLGPVFNAQSCVACHSLGGSGGAGGLDRNIEIVTATDASGQYGGYTYSFFMDFGAGRMEYSVGNEQGASSLPQMSLDRRLLASIHPGFAESRSVVLHRFGTDSEYEAWRARVAGRHGSILVERSERNPPALFGAGVIDTIADEAIEANAKKKPGASAVQVKGRVSRLKDGRIGRFGWKGQTATLEDFVLSAAAGEIGLEVPKRHQAADPRVPGLGGDGFDMDQAECDALVAYVRSLPRPSQNAAVNEKDSIAIKAGQSTFKSIGCAGCHIPKLGNVEGIYSDLLLHDMGQKLGDGDTYTVFAGETEPAAGPRGGDRAGAGNGEPSVREWRTPPLWGLRVSGPYLHDGRAKTIAMAIGMHGGQGATSARRYAELTARRKQQVDAFLMSLEAPAPGP